MPIVIVGAVALAGGLAWKLGLGGPQAALMLAGGGALILLLGLLQLNKRRKAAAPKDSASTAPEAQEPGRESPVPAVATGPVAPAQDPEKKVPFWKKEIGKSSKPPKPKKERPAKEKRTRGRKLKDDPDSVEAHGPAGAASAEDKKVPFWKKEIGGKGRERKKPSFPEMDPALDDGPLFPDPEPGQETRPLLDAPLFPEPEPRQETRPLLESPLFPEQRDGPGDPVATEPTAPTPDEPAQTGSIVQELQEQAARPKGRRVCSYCWEPNDPASSACSSCQQPLALRAS
jgi:hypothetical protein